MMRLSILILLILSSQSAENIKSIDGVAKANIKSIGGVSEANIKSIDGVDNTSSGGSTFILLREDGSSAILREESGKLQREN